MTKNKNKDAYFTITISGESYKDQLKLIEIANKNCADWLILQPPAKKKLSEIECFEFFNKIQRSNFIPIFNSKKKTKTWNLVKCLTKIQRSTFILLFHSKKKLKH